MIKLILLNKGIVERQPQERGGQAPLGDTAGELREQARAEDCGRRAAGLFSQAQEFGAPLPPGHSDGPRGPEEAKGEGVPKSGAEFNQLKNFIVAK